MFYNKDVFIYTYGDADDEHSINREGYTLLSNIPISVDMQPYSSEKAKTDYGYDIKCTKRMFCDINSSIKESAIIKYNQQFYSIQKIIEWDDYMEIMLLETKDVTVNA
ncbi:MAG: hypothetical protein ACM3X7_06875 [Solirubrobacterales bacterium]